MHLSRAYDSLQGFAESLAIPVAHTMSGPVAHTMSGKGALACTHPLSAGPFGRYLRIANDLIETSDCLLVVGCKLGEIATKRYRLLPPGVPIIQLDIVAEEIGRTAQPDVALWGGAQSGLEDLRDALSEGAARARAGHDGYLDEVRERMTNRTTSPSCPCRPDRPS